MTKQEKERTMKLARYITCALMLGNGLLFAPMAEAQNYEVTSSDTPPGMTKDTNSVKDLYPATGAENDKVTVNYSGDAWTGFYIYGGFSKTNGVNLLNRTIEVINGKLANAIAAEKNIYGGNVSYNHAIISGGNVTSGAFGGRTSIVAGKGTASYNTVTINGGTFGDTFKVVGGEGDKANNNTVTVNGGTFLPRNQITGGLGGYSGTSEAKDNTVNINTAVKLDGYDGGIYGGSTSSGTSTGNTLNLGAWGTSATDIGYFQKIVIGYTDTESVKHLVDFANGKTVLHGGTITVGTANKGVETLDIRANEGIFKAATGGTMTLLSSNSNLSGIKLISSHDTTGEGELIGEGIPIKEDTTDQYSTANNVTLTYRGLHKVVLANSNKNINYQIQSKAKDVSFSAIAWNTTTPARSGTDFLYDGDTTINASNLSFTGITADPMGKNMTLLSNATGITDANITPSEDMNLAFTDAKGIKYTGTASGAVGVVTSGTTQNVNYTFNNGTMKTINLSGWDGNGGITLDSGWSAPTGGVFVDTGSFTANPAGGTIITATTGFFGEVTGDKAYSDSGTFSGDTDKGVTLSGTKSGGVRVNPTDTSKLEYVAEQRNATENIVLGDATWGDGRAAASNYDFSGITGIDASNLKFTAYKSPASANTIKADDTMTILSGASNLAADLPVTYASGTSHSQGISYKDSNSVTLSGTLKGNVSTVANEVDYKVTSKTLENISLNGWNGTGGLAIDASWTPPTGGQIAVDTGTFTPPSVAPGTPVDIFTAPTGTTFGTVTGTRTYKDNEPFKDPAKGGVTLEGTTSGGVQTTENATKLTYTGIGNTVSKITLGKITSPTATFGSEYSFTGASVDDSGLSFENPENIGDGDNVTLFTANSSLTLSGSTDKTVSYSTTPVTGVTLNGQITGSYSNTNGAMTYNATANNAQKLTFGNVEWKDTGALIDHSTTLTKVNFAGASVDTSNINFTNIKELEAKKQMTLVSNFDGTPGTITGSKYKVGSTLQGEGKASMDGDNLIFTADTTAEKMQVQEQTHNTLMGASASMTSLAQGNEFINRTMDDMFLSANVGRDGIASFAHIGGGSLRQETGSHVNTRTWNAIVALGHQNKKPRNTFEYGAFVEYGTGNYTTYNGDERGDGSSRYVGGGLMAKWTAPSGLYVEGSLRGGSINDDGHNLLRDVNGVPYSYNVDTPYYGFHLGVGKKIPMKGGNTLDLFAKYFYNHRNSTSFDAGGHYELDAITSQIIRVGARYTVKRDKWNYYGGLAYEHELDGKGGGWADGMAIRGVDTSGGSFRAELGATVTPNEDIPLTLDFNLVGFAGKKQGIFGGMGLKFNF